MRTHAKLTILQVLVSSFLIPCLATRAPASDWPTYRHDNQRSGVTAENLELPLKKSWVYSSANRPVPAWPGPATADYYTSNQRPLKPRLAYDRAFHVAAVGPSVYFGSSADDSVYCLDASTGGVRWSFTTDGPVRMAPTVNAGNVYVGSDDGSVYCLVADDATLRWKSTPAGEGNYLVPSDGRFVSPWMIRSGVVVYGGRAYFSAGIFPAEGVYICAVDTNTGSSSGPNLWKKLRTNDVSLQGYMLSSSTRLYFPAGRSSPYVFNRANGDLLGQFRSGQSRGTFALLAGSRLITGPASRDEALIEEFSASQPSSDSIASYAGGNSMVVTAATSYLLRDSALTALERSSREVVWHRDVSYPYALILAGKVLFAGGEGEVAAFDTETGETLWTGEVSGKAYGLAVAGGALFVSTDSGNIYAFSEPGMGVGEYFVRGDSNADGFVDISDAITVLFHLFVGNSRLTCADHGDADDSGSVELTDSIYLLDFLFRGGPPPAAPYPEEGLDLTPDAAACGDPL